MEFNYNKSTLNSILKNALYYFLWGLAFNVLVFIVIWILSKWKFMQVFQNPFLNPFKNIWFWIIMGAVIGWFKRKQNIKMTLKRWGRTFLYIFIFGAFITSLQLYYVHRKNGGWNGLTGPECVHKYQHYFLIKSKQHFANLDNCLIGKKAQKDPDYKASPYRYRHLEDFKGQLIDYDIINPKIIWGLIIFSLIIIIELFRKQGPIRTYKGISCYVNYWQEGFSAYKKAQLELVFLGASSILILLFLLPKINGLPNSKIPIFLAIAIAVVVLREVIKKPNGTYFSSSKSLQLFYFMIGVLLSCILLIISAGKGFYLLILISIVGYLVISKLAVFPMVKVVILLMVLLDVDTMFGLDDGTWNEGTNILDDSDGDISVNQAEENGGAAALVADIAQEDEEEEEEEEPRGRRDPFDALIFNPEISTKEYIIEKVLDLKERLEGLKENGASSDQGNIDRAIKDLNTILEAVSSNQELSIQDIDEINNIMEYPNSVYKSLTSS
ncbi:hypothetical protein Q4Q34_16985 [Flavivirga abyssicola]|uniref:hypothetical protein n=1 Tax=Flavivirga abyssicola TaxID=3063533 RepID=UPI0026DF47E9|nr:hypothetical protein [Flavivirga sp. MEBiC07777]WVK12911.1 hypothetical protein Q4Q34_16985 [Flavivirga sp. MEBiC07777]